MRCCRSKGEHEDRFGVRARCWFFTRRATGEVCTSKLNYCLGCGAVFIVVVVTALLMSVLSNASLVFLSLAEAEVGEIDLSLGMSGMTEHNTINYTLARSILGEEGRFSYHTPRSWVEASAFSLNLCLPEASTRHTASVNTSTGLGSSGWTYETCAARYDDSVSVSCLEGLCGPEDPTYPDTVARVMMLNTVRDRRAGLGRAYRYGRIPFGEAVVHETLAVVLGVGVGDTIYVRFNMFEQLPGMMLNMMEILAEREGVNGTIFDTSIDMGQVGFIHVPLRVHGLMDSSQGKFSSSRTDAVVVEFDDVVEMLVTHMHPNGTQLAEVTAEADIYEYTDQIVVNLPPRRITPYLSSDYDTIQKNVLDFTSKVVYAVGFNQMSADEPIVENLRESRFFALFLGLILNIIIFILTGLSVLLIYSLLMVDVETRTFDVGVMRMLGLTRWAVVEFLLVKSMTYAVPAYVLGMIASQLGFMLLARVFKDATEVEISPVLALEAVLVATALAFAIPAIASLFPILKSLRMSLVESLQVHRSKTAAVKVDIERSREAFSWPLVVVGSSLAIFGFLIYYLLPLALLSFNLTLLLNIFFGLLLAMLLGLALLALNLQHFAERLVLMVFVGWWESSAVQAVVLKNLIAHRLRNRKTTLMYSVSLAVIIFISVSFSLQIQTFVYQTQQERGARLVVKGASYRGLDELEPILHASPYVNNWALVSTGLEWAMANVTEIELTNLGRFFFSEVKVFGVSPNFYGVTLDGFLNVAKWLPGYKHNINLAEQLYLPRGSHSLLVSSVYRDLLDLENLDQHIVVRAEVGVGDRGTGYTHWRGKPMAFVDSSPVFTFTKFPALTGLDVVGSLHTVSRIAATGPSVDGPELVERKRSIDDLFIEKVLIHIDPDLGDEERDELIFDLRNFSVDDIRTDLDPLGTAEVVLNYFFLFTTVVALVICFFSLISSIFSNIRTQTKEIGVLRSLGMRRGQMRRVYIEESFVLVFSSAVMGMLIGVAVGWTMTLQRVLFTQLPVPFVFPWQILILVFFMSGFSAIAASFLPIHRLVRRSIVDVMRMRS